MLVTKDIFKDAAGKPAGIVGIFQDITERKQSEMVSRTSQEKLRRILDNLNIGVVMISSDLKLIEMNQQMSIWFPDIKQDLNQLISAHIDFKNEMKRKSDIAAKEDVAEAIKKLEALEEDIDFDYIKNDAVALIEESREGAERIKKIVEDLKYFAHPGQDKVQGTDINKGLSSTLNVVTNELKYKAKVITEFGDLPIISANPQQLIAEAAAV